MYQKFENTHKNIISLFKKQVSLNRLSHAYLIEGKLAYDFSLYLSTFLLENSPLILLGNHPNLLIAHKDYRNIKKEDVEIIRSNVSRTNTTQEKRIIILNHVENASASAMNSLLKFIEEPQKDIIFFLTTLNKNKVLDTLVSRCMYFKLNDQYDLDMSLFQAYNQKDVLDLSLVYKKEEDIKEALENQRILSILDRLREHLSKIEKGHRESIVQLYADYTQELKLELDEFNIFLMIMMKKSRNNDIRKILLEAQSQIRPGLNVNLLMDWVFTSLYRKANIYDSKKF